MNQFKALMVVLLLLCAYRSETSFGAVGQTDVQSQNDSSAVRKGQTFYLTPGVGLTMGLGAGIRFGYFLGPDYVLEYATNVATNLVSQSETNQAVMIRSFLGNSFNIALGMNKRRMESGFLADAVASTFESAIEQASDPNVKSIRNHTTATDYGVQLFLGNQWQWRSVTIGIDWVGYYHPLEVADSKLVQDISFKDGHNERRESKLKKGENLGPSLSALWLHTGISF